MASTVRATMRSTPELPELGASRAAGRRARRRRSRAAPVQLVGAHQRGSSASVSEVSASPACVPISSSL